MGRLDGKVALVTGAAQGLGKAIAERFAAEGAVVVATDMKQPPGGKLAGSIEFHTLDVTEPDHWSRVVEAALAKHKRIDILVNNAGIVFSYAPIHETSLEDWDKVVGVNQKGTFLGMRAVLPTMMKQHAGSIINISSIWGVVGAAGVAPY